MDLAQYEQMHKTFTAASALLRRVAGDSSIQRTASAEQPSLDEERVREVCEDMAVLGLAKKAEIEPTVENVMNDPNELLGILRKAAAVIAATDSQEIDPGTLVNKKASVRSDPIEDAKAQARAMVERAMAGAVA